MPIILIDEPKILKGQIPSKYLKLNPVDSEQEAYAVAKSFCRTNLDAIGFTVRELHHD